jgi:hypothetical protein
MGTHNDDNVKDALAKDWEQTKNDLGVDGTRDLDQDVDDTVRQMAGKDDPKTTERTTPGRRDS